MDNKKKNRILLLKQPHVIFINSLNVGFDKIDTKLSYERKNLIREFLHVTFKKVCL